MSDQPTPEWQRAIKTYQESYRQLIRFGTYLIETDQDLTALKEVIDGLTETQAKELLTVSAAPAAHDYVETRRGANLN